MFGKSKDNKAKGHEIGDVLKGFNSSDLSLKELEKSVGRMEAIVNENSKNLRKEMEEMTKGMTDTLKKHERK